MHKTRWSLYYLLSYLWSGGIGLLAAPRLASDVLLSDTEYPAIMLRALGMFLIGLGIFICEIIRLRAEALYVVTLEARLFFCICLMAFYATTGNPFFLVLFGIVALGVLLTGGFYLSERRRVSST